MRVLRFGILAAVTACASAMACASVVSVASADSSGIGPTYTDRPLTVPRGALRVDAGPRWSLRPGSPMRDGTLGIDHLDLPTPAGGDRTHIYLNAGATVGVTDDFQLGVLVLPLLLSPDVDYADPVVHGMYRFKRGNVEAGVFVAIDLPINDRLDVTGGVPLIVRLGSAMRLDLAALMHVRFGGGSSVDVMVPMELAFNVSSSVFVGPESGFAIIDFDRVAVPLGLFAGYSVGRLGDLRAELRLPHIGDGFDRFQILLRADLYFDL